MIRGLYISASGMSTQLKRQEVISNNLANIDTPGFKKDSLVSSSFSNILVSRLDDPQDRDLRPSLGNFSLESFPQEVFTDFSQGKLIYTGRDLDFSLQGKGFFVVDTPWGRRYTRAGDFVVSPQGILITTEGYPVLGENGPMEVGEKEFYFTQQGELVVEKEIVNKFLVVDIPYKELSKEGDTLFKAREDVVNPLSSYTLLQGFLESSNVNVVKEMVDMISGLRLYEANQRAILMQDGSLDRLINEALRG